MLTLDYCVRNPNALVRVRVWDVRWADAGIGKHGAGPFASEYQAARCLDAVGWPGEVVSCWVITSARNAYRIFRGGQLPDGSRPASQAELFPEGV